MLTLAQFDPIPRRVAEELGIMSDCMLYRSDGEIEWACHVRLAVRFEFRRVS